MNRRKFLSYMGCGCSTIAIGDPFFSFLKYFASSLPDGPAINISKLFCFIINNDN